jgi:hypothetical protein
MAGIRIVVRKLGLEISQGQEDGSAAGQDVASFLLGRQGKRFSKGFRRGRIQEADRLGIRVWNNRRRMRE